MAIQSLLIDPRIRDNVFLPMVILMFLVNYIRFYMTKVLNTQSSPLTADASISYRNLRGTIMEHKADPNKEHKSEDEVDLNACLAKIKPDTKHASAMIRSTRFRAKANYLPEISVKQRKAYFCTPDTGYLNQKYVFNQMAMLQNPDMMSNMVKGNIQSAFNIMMFTGIGNIFSGFVIARFPFPLGQKFKTMTQ